MIGTLLLLVLILLAGLIAGKCRLIWREGQSGITNLVLYITLPCSIVESFRLDFEPALLAKWGMTLLVATAVMGVNQAFSHLLFRSQGPERRSVFRYATIVSNSGMLGMSTVSALFGSALLSYGALYLIPQRIAMWTTGVAAFTRERQKGALRKTLVHPCMIAVYIGLSFLALGIRLPEEVENAASVIGGCTMPLAMMLVGSILAEIRASMLLDRTIFFYCAFRLIIIPGVVLLICLALHTDMAITRVSVLMTAMPAGATTSLLALRYGADERLASALVVVSTILFLAVLPLWMMALTALTPSG
jgi:predicted permease